MLAAFPTNSTEDQNILGKLATQILISGSCFLDIGNSCFAPSISPDSMPDATRTLEAVIKYVTVPFHSCVVDLKCSGSLNTTLEI